MHDNQAPTSAAKSTDDSAALQRRVATAIRARLALPHGEGTTRVQTVAMLAKHPGGFDIGTITIADVLAAAAHDDELWDALAQVRQVVVLERATTTQPMPRFRCVCGADRTGGTLCSRLHCATRRADR